MSHDDEPRAPQEPDTIPLAGVFVALAATVVMTLVGIGAVALLLPRAAPEPRPEVTGVDRMLFPLGSGAAAAKLVVKRLILEGGGHARVPIERAMDALVAGDRRP
jgi:hypothetical protein